MMENAIQLTDWDSIMRSKLSHYHHMCRRWCTSRATGKLLGMFQDIGFFFKYKSPINLAMNSNNNHPFSIHSRNGCRDILPERLEISCHFWTLSFIPAAVLWIRWRACAVYVDQEHVVVVASMSICLLIPPWFKAWKARRCFPQCLHRWCTE